jgi:manganese/zinc/iron transport system substrate-binding protein
MLQTMRYRPPAPLLGGLSLFGLALALAACGGGSSPATTAAGDPRPAREKPLVVATTPMVGDLVRAIGGDRIDLVVLIPPGTDPHLWTPTRSDVLQVLDADAVFMNGLMLEGRAGDAFARVEISGRPVIRIAEALPKSELLTDQSNSSHFDPHIWMDPTLWAKTAPAVRDTLSKLDTDGADTYARNLAAFEAEAAALDRECALAIGGIPPSNRTLVTAHDAFGYFGRRYGLEVRGIQGISTESEPALSDIERLVSEITEARVPAIFIETTVSDRSARAVVEGCAAKGHTVTIGEPLYSDSLGRAGSAEGTWAGMIRHNAKSIANALGGRG